MRPRAATTAVLAAAVLLAVAGCNGGTGKGTAAARVTNPGPSASSTPAGTTPPAATPTPVALPYLNGVYRVVIDVTTSNTEKQPAGTRKTRTWKFSGGCATSSCDVTLLREAGWYNANGTGTTKTFLSTATRTATGYHGVEHRPQQCPLTKTRAITGPEQATFDYTIQIVTHKGARPSFTGTAKNTAPAQGGCRNVVQTMVFTGTPA